MSVADNESRAEKAGGARAIDSGKESSGFFTIYRRGQGKWTRLGTAIGSALIIIATGAFIATDVRANLQWEERTALTIAGVFVVLASALVFYLQNRPGNVSFLIDTDGEMKKVNWTTRKELTGSTKVVIGFMFILAAMLFIVDIIFGYLFYFLGVLKFSPGIFERLFK